jgi:histidinol phosphatase-like enzyme
MNEILNAEKPSIEMVLAFCAEEKWDRNEKKKIGF